MNIKKWVATAACLVAMGGALVGCGSSSSSSSSSSGSTGSSTTVKGDPIVIGTICSCSGAQSAALGKSSVGVQAWAKQINANGGLNGHPVKLIVKDDAGDPTKAIQAAKELVEQDKVLAIVGETSVTDQAFQSYVEQKQVPVVGGLAPEATFLTSADFFPSGSSQVVTTFGNLKMAAAAGKKEIGTLYCSETPVCAQVDGLGKALSQVAGIKWTSGKISGTQTSYTAPCLQMKSAGADALFIAHNAEVSVRVAAGCSKAGYKPTMVSQLNTVAADVLASPDFDGALLTGANADYNDEAVSGIKDFRAASEAFEPGVTKSPQFNITVEESWAGAKLFEATAKAANLGPTSTSADVLKGLYALKDETLDGISGPLTFAQGKPSFPNCYFESKIANHELVATSHTPTCISATDMAAVGQILAAMH